MLREFKSVLLGIHLRIILFDVIILLVFNFLRKCHNKCHNKFKECYRRILLWE